MSEKRCPIVLGMAIPPSPRCKLHAGHPGPHDFEDEADAWERKYHHAVERLHQIEASNAARLRLYVVGESSLRPSWREPALVIAESPEQACRLANRHHSDPVTEIPLDTPRFLMALPEPGRGLDL